MNSKHLIWFFAIVFGYIGGFLPSIWGAGGLTMSAIIGNMLGGILGVYIGFKLSKMF